MIVENVRRNLKRLIAETGIKAATGARRAGLNESAIRDILRERSLNPGVDTLDRIAAVYGVSINELVAEEGENTPAELEGAA